MIDPVSLAVIRGRLEQIVDEMDAPLFRAAFSPVIGRIRGPAIVEPSDTTIFVDPGLGAAVDRFGNLVVKPDD